MGSITEWVANYYALLLDIIATCISFIALVVSLRASRLAHAATESQIYEMIANTSEKVMQTGGYDESDHFQNAKQEHCNSYEFACSQYLRYRISKSQFRNIYAKDLLEIVEKGGYDDVLKNVEGKWEYENIKKVYKKILIRKKIKDKIKNLF